MMFAYMDKDNRIYGEYTKKLPLPDYTQGKI